MKKKISNEKTRFTAGTTKNGPEGVFQGETEGETGAAPENDRKQKKNGPKMRAKTEERPPSETWQPPTPPTPPSSSSSAAAAASALADLEVIDGGAGRVAQSSSYIGRERTRTTSSNNNNIIIDTNNNNNNNNSN